MEIASQRESLDAGICLVTLTTAMENLISYLKKFKTNDTRTLKIIQVIIGKKKKELPDWKTMSPGNLPRGIFFSTG